MPIKATVEGVERCHSRPLHYTNHWGLPLQRARQRLQQSLSAYEQEQVAKLLTSLSADGSTDAHAYKQLCTEIHELSTSNDPWTVAMHTKDLVVKATNINQSLDRLKKARSDQELQYMKFSPLPDSIELGTLNLSPIDPKESMMYPGYQGNAGRQGDGGRQEVNQNQGLVTISLFRIKHKNTSRRFLKP